MTELHRDEGGSISLAAVFALLLLTILLGMVINVGRQVDSKVKLQNAADATTYSGGVVLARGMNSLAFTNHMLAETLALTAFMREARDRHAEPYIPDILAGWNRIAPILGRSAFPKFAALGPAIPSKTAAEQQMVTAYGNWMAASSELILPVLDEILLQELIPQFQREVVRQVPGLAQTAAVTIADRHTGNPSAREQPRGPIAGVLWRTIVEPVGGASEGFLGTVPAVDPAIDESYRQQAIAARDRYARHYLSQWNSELMSPFDRFAKMSQFGSLWRSFTCGQLRQLLTEFPDSNFPHVLRQRQPGVQTGEWLNLDYSFVGVAYRKKLRPAAPRVFTDSLAADNQAFAQGFLFVPRARPLDIWYDRLGYPHFSYNSAPRHWDLWNENWSFQLVPALSASIPHILQAPPDSPFVPPAASAVQRPVLGNLDTEDFRRLTAH
jgi:putative Flp pilus-assembly TadE/G-like protein